MDGTSFGLTNMKMTIGLLLNSITAGVHYDRNTIIINDILSVVCDRSETAYKEFNKLNDLEAKLRN